MNSRMVLASSPNNEIPKKLPAPKISRILPSTVKDNVKPIPIPIASKTDWNALFFYAKASALPKMMQLTTIKGM